MTLAEKKEREIEMKKRANADKNLNIWFKDIFQAFAKDDEDNYSAKLQVKVSTLKVQDSNRRLFKFLCGHILGENYDQSLLINKGQFIKLFQSTKREQITEGDITQLFLMFTN